MKVTFDPYRPNVLIAGNVDRWSLRRHGVASAVQGRIVQYV